MLIFEFAFLLYLCVDVYGQDRRLEDRYMHPHLAVTLDRGPFYNFLQDNATFWRVRAQKTVRQLLQKTKNENIAKNVILFMGDGMSFPTIAAGRVYVGGEEEQLSFDKFPYTALSKTYCVDKQVPDSACTSTAYLTGVKGNYQTIGVAAAVSLDDCKGMNDTTHHTHSIAAWSQAVNKKTGFVTTARVTHASPAGVYAHTAERNWECDTDILDSNEDPKICRDIAYQLVHFDTGKKLNVILGGGRGEFLPKETVDEEGDNGFRSDRRNLIQEWLDEKKNDGKDAQFIWNKRQLLNIEGNAEYLLGMFDASHIPYNLDRDTDKDPSLEEMVEAAIKVLRNGEEGYFLFVEGGRIDTAHHEVKARKALDELAEFSKAIQKAVDMTNERDTLIVVTADHAHSMTYSGYPDRGKDVLGLSGIKDQENMDYLTINYANGAGYRRPNADGSRVDVSSLRYTDKDFQYPGLFPLRAETHGGDDVGIFAQGPWSHLFTGVLEENVIPHVMAYASCVGDGLTVCNDRPDSSSGQCTGNSGNGGYNTPPRRTTRRPQRPTQTEPNDRYQERPQERPHERPQERPYERPQERPHERPQERPYERPQERPHERPQERPQVRPQVRPQTPQIFAHSSNYHTTERPHIWA